MTDKATTKPAKKNIRSKKTKIEIIQEMYGRDKTSASLEDTSKYLNSIGFKSLGDLLQPSK